MNTVVNAYDAAWFWVCEQSYVLDQKKKKDSMVQCYKSIWDMTLQHFLWNFTLLNTNFQRPRLKKRGKFLAYQEEDSL